MQINLLLAWAWKWTEAVKILPKMILVNWLFFNPLACITTQNPWWRNPSFDCRSMWMCLLSSRAVSCCTQAGLDLHISWFATSLLWAASRPHGNQQKDFTGRKQMTKLVQHSPLSKIALHLSGYCFLFPLLHILIHHLAKHDIRQKGKYSLLVAKCILDFSWQFLYSGKQFNQKLLQFEPRG